MSSWGKRALSLIMALIFVFALLPAVTVPAAAAGVDVHMSGTTGGCKWSLDSGATLSDGTTGMLLKVWKDGTGVMGDNLGKMFSNYSENIEEVEICEGVKNVGDYFLYDNSEGYQNGEYAGYYYNGLSRFYALRRILIPDSVTSVGKYGLAVGYLSPCVVTLSGVENIESLGDYAFRGLKTDNDICFPKLTVIENGFEGFAAKSLTFPNVETVKEYGLEGVSAPIVNLGTKLRTIEKSGFYSAHMRELYLPATLEKIGGYATYACSSLTDVYYAGTQAQWEAIDIENNPMWGSGSDTSNHCLFDATLHCNYVPTISDGTATIDTYSVTGRTLSVTLTGTAATLSSSALKYQWQRSSGSSWVNISGATGSTYTVTGADDYKEIRVQVTATGYTGTLTSNFCYCRDGLEISSANFPDSVFCSYLSDNFDKNGDGILEGLELDNITELHLGGTSVASLEGVQYLYQLQYIYAYHTAITSFSGADLRYLFILDLSECALDSLDVTGNANLRELYISSCKGSLRNPDFSGNPRLEALETYDSSFSIMDISYCPRLVDAALHGTVSSDSNGKWQLFKLSKDNYFMMDGYTANVTIAHFDEAFPNARFRSEMQNKNYNWDSNNDLSLAEALNVTALFPEDGEELTTDLTGIEYFPNLDYLSAFNCRIPYVDLSGNRKLTDVDFGGNLYLHTLNVAMLPLLQNLNACRCGMSEVALGENGNLCDLRLWDNELTEIDLSGLPNLDYLDLDSNELTNLDVSNNPALTNLKVSNNSLASLDVTGNPALTNLSCYGNSIAALDISQNPNLQDAVANGTQVTKTDSDTGVEFVQYKNGSNVLNVDKNTTINTGSTSPTITTQPTSQTVAVGEKATFRVVASGTGLTYQWQYSKNGTTWTDKAGATSASYTVTAKASYNGLYYRCKVSNAGGEVFSNKARLTVTSTAKPVITTQPANKTVAAGEKATFRVVASGTGLTYQWQYKTTGSSTWKDKTGATSASYTVTAKASYNGMLYRCIVTNAGGSVTSGTAKLTVTVAKPVITTQPKAQTAAVGATATYKVVASGTGLTYQWQYSSDYGATWHNKTGATSATYTVTAKASYNGMLYRCKVSNSAGAVYSSKVRLTVSGVKPKVLSQPKAKTAAVGESVTFKVVAAGVDMTYQWQYSFDGTTWKNKTGATSASCTVTAKASYNGILYRCRVKNSYGTVYSESAKLTVS